MENKLVLQNIEGKVKGKIPVLFFKEGKKFIAYCPVIDISTCGDTEEQASKRISEAAAIFFNEIIKMGTVDDVLSERGWQKVAHEDSWSAPEYKHKLVPISEGVC
jgi:hypothetical protein